jgi:histidyl-tRNA synthetase
MPGISGVGISFGADRIYDVLNSLNLYPTDAVSSTQVLFINFGEKEAVYCLTLINRLREAGIRVEIYPDSAKMKKQMSYANNKSIPFVALIGENEIKESKITLKNMSTGEQNLITIEEMIDIVANSTE